MERPLETGALMGSRRWRNCSGPGGTVPRQATTCRPRLAAPPPSIPLAAGWTHPVLASFPHRPITAAEAFRSQPFDSLMGQVPVNTGRCARFRNRIGNSCWNWNSPAEASHVKNDSQCMIVIKASTEEGANGALEPRDSVLCLLIELLALQ